MLSPEEMQRRQEVQSCQSLGRAGTSRSLPNVTGVFTGRKVTAGVDTGLVTIVVTVTEKKDVPQSKRYRKEINGVPTDVIEEKSSQCWWLMQFASKTLCRWSTQPPYATLEGGMSIGPCRSFSSSRQQSRPRVTMFLPVHSVASFVTIRRVTP